MDRSPDRTRRIPSVSRSDFAEISRHLKHTENDVTGGMKGKIEELLDLGTPAYIVNARKPERIQDLFEGRETISTKVHS